MPIPAIAYQVALAAGSIITKVILDDRNRNNIKKDAMIIAALGSAAVTGTILAVNKLNDKVKK